jgi:uroporphyrinogen III methyltransferase/synthase
MAPGTVYLVGAGPGNPGLITVRGAELLSRAGAVLYDALAENELLRRAPQAEHIYVGKRPGQKSISQEDLNALLVEMAQSHEIVVRLKGGDPFVFGRGGEEAQHLREHGIAFEAVPGVTAGIGAPAYAGIPVTHRNTATSVSFITGHRDPKTFEEVVDMSRLSLDGTLVFYMGVKNLPRLVDQLIALGRPPDTPAAVVEWGTQPHQRTRCASLSTIVECCREAEIKPPSIIIIGEVVNLRDELNWFENRPLFGLRIAVTRARAQAGALAQHLIERGADVFEFPTIEVQPLGAAAPFASVADYDWIVLTSVNAAEALLRHMENAGEDARTLHGVKLCAIGSATSKAMTDRFLMPDLTPDRYDSEHLLEALQQSGGGVKGKRILLPRSDIAPRLLPEALAQSGAIVTEWTAYRTALPSVGPEKVQELLEFNPELVVFTSSSTARNFHELMGQPSVEQLRKRASFAAIGPMTAKTAKGQGMEISVQPEQHDIPSLVAAIVHWRAGGVR